MIRTHSRRYRSNRLLARPRGKPRELSPDRRPEQQRAGCSYLESGRVTTRAVAAKVSPKLSGRERLVSRFCLTAKISFQARSLDETIPASSESEGRHGIL